MVTLDKNLRIIKPAPRRISIQEAHKLLKDGRVSPAPDLDADEVDELRTKLLSSTRTPSEVIEVLSGISS